MKTVLHLANAPVNAYRHYRRPSPNAAEPRYFIDKLIDGVLSFAIGMGILTILFFLLTM